MKNFNQGGGNRFGGRSMHRAVCDECGKDCEIPFKPSAGKPVYCSQCFSNRGGGNRDGGNRDGGNRDRGGRDRDRGGRDNRDRGAMPNAQLEALNSKLDKILDLLTSYVKSEPTIKKAEVKIEKVEEKKVVKKVSAKTPVKKATPKKAVKKTVSKKKK